MLVFCMQLTRQHFIGLQYIMTQQEKQQRLVTLAVNRYTLHNSNSLQANVFKIYIFIRQNGSTQKNTNIQTNKNYKNTLITHYVHSQSITIFS